MLNPLAYQIALTLPQGPIRLLLYILSYGDIRLYRVLDAKDMAEHAKNLKMSEEYILENIEALEKSGILEAGGEALSVSRKRRIPTYRIRPEYVLGSARSLAEAEAKVSPDPIGASAP